MPFISGSPHAKQITAGIAAFVKAQEKKHQKLWEGIADALIICDESGAFLDANENLRLLLGYAKSDLDGKNLCDIEYSKSDLPLLHSQIPGLIQKGLGSFDADVVTKEGKVISLNVNARIVRFEEERRIYMYARDISRSTYAERILEEEKRRLELVTQSSGIGLCIVSRDFRILWTNEILKSVFGDIEDKVCYRTVHKRGSVCPGCAVRQIFDTGSEKAVHEQMAFDRTGNPVWAQIVATPLRDAQGYLYAAFEIMVPSTERKLMEEKIRRSEELLSRQKGALEKKEIALQEVMESIELQKKKQLEDCVVYLNKVVVPLIEKLKRKKNFDSESYALLEQALHDMNQSHAMRSSAYLQRLSSREVEICMMIKKGYTSKEIAANLNISTQTVDKHRQHIRKKFRLSQEFNLYTYLSS